MRQPWAVLALLSLLLSACSPAGVSAPDARPLVAASLPADEGSPSGPPAGRVRVVVPDEPAAWWNPDQPDVAAQDLAGLWGLPLLRVDEHGQLRRGLVQDWHVVGDVAEGWAVDLVLAAGTWSDGEAVRADDVVATLTAAAGRDPRRFGAIRSAEALEDGSARVVFTTQTATWADLLVEVGPVLPADHVADAATTYADEVPVSGGPFRLASYEPGLRAVFEAHEGSALGAPMLAEVQVLFSPRYETALGLLETDEADVALGYLALNPVARAQEVEDVQAAAPVGGTTVSVEFRDGGAFGADEDAGARRGVRDAVDVDLLVEGLLGDFGQVASTPWPAVSLPVDRPWGELGEGRTIVLGLPASNEVLSFTGRTIERDLTSRGVEADLVSTPTPHFPAAVGAIGDGSLVVSRTPRHPSLAGVVPEEAVATIRAGEAAGWPSEAATEALAAVATAARVLPLYRPGVLHAWRDVVGIRPSAWPGAGFWNVSEWALPEPG